MPESDADALDRLVQASFEVVAVVTRVGAEHDLSLTLTRMLGILRDRTLTMADLADYLGLERSTVSGLVDRAQARGLVARTANAADGRSVQIALTRAGATLAQDAEREIAAKVAPIVESHELRRLAAAGDEHAIAELRTRATARGDAAELRRLAGL